jgi:acetyltransferase-like isoleucine patch superfamily enzyme
MNKHKIIVALKILVSFKFYEFVISDLFSYFPRIFRKYEMLVDRGNIRLGKNIFIDRTSILLAPIGSNLSIGDRTTINGNCTLIGDITIERDCLLSYNIYISSGNHQAMLVPEWLIRDQDNFYASSQVDPTKQNASVHIEEDCWIGWGVFIKQGIYIGRGAVIGASAVITRDVPPYSIQVGIPNRAMSPRLNFDPPSSLAATNQQHIPYFYCGFLVRQSEIEKSRQLGILVASKVVRLMLKGSDFQHISLSGHLLDGVKRLKLSLKCNSVNLGELLVENQDFNLSLDKLDLDRHQLQSRSPVLSQYNEIEIAAVIIDNNGLPNDSGKIEYLYGIRTISIG